MNAAAMGCRPVTDAEAQRQYLEALNVCFPAWGGREMFDWCFTRESAGLRPDVMTLHAGSGVVAGTANTYRRIRLSNGETLVAAIMTGSWTLPASRGLGAFTRLIGESRDLAAARGAGLLLAFVTRTNGSASRLRDAGAALFPTWYCRSRAESRTDRVDDRVDAGEGTIDDADAGDDAADVTHDTHDMHGTNGGQGVRFVYRDDEWRQQFIQRPSGIMRVRGVAPARADASADAEPADRASRWRALLERTPQFDRVLSLSLSRADTTDSPGIASVEPAPGDITAGDSAAGETAAGDTAAADGAWLDAIAALEARAAAASRRLFCFTSEAHQASQLRDRGFEIVDGYITALIANEAILRAACTAGRGAPGSSDALSSRALMSQPPMSQPPMSQRPMSKALTSQALTSQALADAASPWCLGGWSVRNGDRM